MLDPKINISFVIAAYNGQKYIKAQLESILKFLNQNDEIIVSDDCSNDSTCSIVRSLDDPRIFLIENVKQVGYQKNFERAIRVARGNYIFFSDQDDICTKERIDVSLLMLKKFNVVAGDAEIVDENLRLLDSSYFKIRDLKSFSFLNIIWKPRIIGATLAVRRDFLTYALPFSKKIPHDHWLSSLAALKNQLAVSSEIFIRYRRHGSNVTSWERSAARPLRIIFRDRILLLTCIILKLIKVR